MVDEATVVLLLAGAVLARVVRVAFRLARVVVTAQAARLVSRRRVIMVCGSRHLSSSSMLLVVVSSSRLLLGTARIARKTPFLQCVRHVTGDHASHPASIPPSSSHLLVEVALLSLSLLTVLLVR